MYQLLTQRFISKGERPLHLDDAISDMDDDDFNQQTFDSRSSFFIVSKNDSEQPNSYPYSSSSISVGVSEFTHTMHESFVGVEPSTSAELGQHRLSLPGATADDDRSTGKMDETFEGRSHQHETLLLLKTKAPLWVPLTQVRNDCHGLNTTKSPCIVVLRVYDRGYDTRTSRDL
jgi:hypothetical protein